MWVQSLIWSQLYAAWSYMNDTGTSRHEALRLILRTILRGGDRLGLAALDQK